MSENPDAIICQVRQFQLGGVVVVLGRLFENEDFAPAGEHFGREGEVVLIERYQAGKIERGGHFDLLYEKEILTSSSSSSKLSSSYKS